MTIATGGGDDTLVMEGTVGDRATDVDTGSGADHLEFRGWASGPVHLATGEDDDIVTLCGSSPSGPLLLNTDAGNDLVTLEVCPPVFCCEEALRLVGGSGNDRLEVIPPVVAPLDAPDFEAIVERPPSATP